jgi:hypothetical protein
MKQLKLTNKMILLVLIPIIAIVAISVTSISCCRPQCG